MKTFFKYLGFRTLPGTGYRHERKKYIQGKYEIEEYWSVVETLKYYYFLGFCFYCKVLETKKGKPDISKKKLFTKWKKKKGKWVRA